jgi:hypothetical protein
VVRTIVGSYPSGQSGAMCIAALAFTSWLASLLPGQTVTATATGTLEIMWQGTGAAQSMTQPVYGTTTL